MNRRTGAPAAALIFAGGRGIRFWPLSRIRHPKPLFAPDGRTTLLAAAIARARTVVPRERIFVIVAAEHARAFRAAIRGLVPPHNLIVEPVARGTAVAVAYGAAFIAKRFGAHTIVVATPSDHLVTPLAGFAGTVTSAIKLAAAHQAIVVIGVPPTRAEIGYGYQRVGPRFGIGFKVAKFIEKPSRRAAERMVRAGGHLWNAGMFVMSAATLAAELKDNRPDLARAIGRLIDAPHSRFAALYRQLDFQSFDREIVAKSAHVLGVRAQFKWHDVGSWEGLWEATRGKSDKVIVGDVVAVESAGVLARAGARPMVLLGVRDLIAVDAGDAILIADRGHSSKMRKVVDELRRRGLSRYL